jgi:hypothetical protein
MSDVKWTDVLDYFGGRDPDEVYFYCHSGHCAAAQFHAVRGEQYIVPTIPGGRHQEFNIGRKTGDGQVDLEICAAAEPHTFGALTQRVKEFI